MCEISHKIIDCKKSQEILHPNSHTIIKAIFAGACEYSQYYRDVQEKKKKRVKIVSFLQIPAKTHFVKKKCEFFLSIFLGEGTYNTLLQATKNSRLHWIHWMQWK